MSGFFTTGTITSASLHDTLEAMKEEQKIMMYDAEGRYVGIKTYISIDNDNYKLIELNKYDINLKRINDQTIT